MNEVRTLGELAEDAGLGLSDVAFLAGLTDTTIGRMWTDPDWLDRASGRTLTALIGVMPGLANYIQTVAIGQRFDTITTDLATHGLHVNHQAITTALAEGDAREHLATALRAAALLVAGDERATGHLARSFGHHQDRALGRLFDGLLTDPTPLIDAATATIDALQAKRSTPQAFMASATLRHHLARATGHTTETQPASNRNQRAFIRRSTAIGLVLATNDPSIVDAYAADVARDRLAARIDQWAMTAYCRDIRPGPDFWLPRGVVLRHTATEVLRELAEFNDAYAAYLATVFLPLALQLDPTFGGRRDELPAALRARGETIDDTTTTTHLHTLVRQLERTAA